jgi:hypothetical protein
MIPPFDHTQNEIVELLQPEESVARVTLPPQPEESAACATTGLEDFQYDTVPMEDFPRFDFDGPDVVGGVFPVNVGPGGCHVAAPAPASITVPATMKTPADTTAPVVTDDPDPSLGTPSTTTSTLFSGSQDNTVMNARAFAMHLKREEERRYEGVSASQDNTIIGATYRSPAHLKSKEKMAIDFFNVLASVRSGALL